MGKNSIFRAVKFLAYHAEKRPPGEFRVLRRVIAPLPKRPPHWLPGLIASLGGRPIRRGRWISCYALDRDSVLNQYALMRQHRLGNQGETNDRP
jgi:hypothetical protein